MRSATIVRFIALFWFYQLAAWGEAQGGVVPKLHVV